MFEIIELQRGELLEKGIGIKIYEMEEELSIYDTIQLNNSFYNVVCKYENQIGVRKFVPLDKYELVDKHYIQCPFCGYNDIDSWESEDAGITDCGNCGAELEYKRRVEVTYDIELKNKPNIVRLGE